MLDKRGTLLLQYLYLSSNQSGYKVFSFDEIKDGVSKDIVFDNDTLRTYIRELIKMELISAGYEDEKEICLSVTQKGRLYCEMNEDEKKDKKRTQRRLFTCSFLGAFLGSLIVFFIASVICFLFGGLCLLK